MSVLHDVFFPLVCFSPAWKDVEVRTGRFVWYGRREGEERGGVGLGGEGEGGEN